MSFEIHSIECTCFVGKNKFSFNVFSEILDENDEVVPSFEQCPNCQKLYKISDIFSATPVKTSDKIETISDVQSSLPEHVRAFFIDFEDLDLAQWKKIRYLYKSELWKKPDWSIRNINHGNSVVIYTEFKNGIKYVKRAFFASERQILIKNVETNEIVEVSK